MQKNWYMIYTRQNSEKRICALLKRNRLESFCPINRRQLTRFGKTKFLSIPLFSSYVFARLKKEDFGNLNRFKDILNIVYWKDQPAVIQNEEIETIKIFISENTDVRVEKSLVNDFTSPTVISDSSYAMQGDILNVKSNSVKIYLPSIGVTLIAENQREKEAKGPSLYQENLPKIIIQNN
jgi:transcription antitermination factor NusG